MKFDKHYIFVNNSLSSFCVIYGGHSVNVENKKGYRNRTNHITELVMCCVILNMNIVLNTHIILAL
jgi:hypothetical protein